MNQYLDLSKKLTINDVVNAIEELEKSRINSFTFHTSNLLKGTQTIIKDDNNIYCPPDIQKGEIKVLNFKKEDAIKLLIAYH